MANLEGFIAEALDEKGQSFADINKMQMLESKRSDEATITPRYSPNYAKRKGFSNPNLKLKGDFQADMFFQTDGREFFITSSDDKMPWLVDRYSEKIFGIAPSKAHIGQEIALSSIARIWNKFVLNG